MNHPSKEGGLFVSEPDTKLFSLSQYFTQNKFRFIIFFSIFALKVIVSSFLIDRLGDKSAQ